MSRDKELGSSPHRENATGYRVNAIKRIGIESSTGDNDDGSIAVVIDQDQLTPAGIPPSATAVIFENPGNETVEPQLMHRESFIFEPRDHINLPGSHHHDNAGNPPGSIA